MPYTKKKPKEYIQLDPEDWTKAEWKTLVKLFGAPLNVEAIRVTISKLEMYTPD